MPNSKLQNRYLIYLENLSIFERCRCRSYYKRGERLPTCIDCVAQNGNLMFLSPWGKFFSALSIAVCATYLPWLRVETNSTKTLFPCFDIAHCLRWNEKQKYEKKNTAAREKHFTIQSCLVITCFMCSPSPRDVSITMWCNHGQKRAHRQFRNANCVDRSMMDWKMIVAKFLWMLCKASNFIGTRLRKNVDSQQIIAIEFVWKWNNFKIISVNKLEIEVLPWKALKRHVLPCQQTFFAKVNPPLRVVHTKRWEWKKVENHVCLEI